MSANDPAKGVDAIFGELSMWWLCFSASRSSKIIATNSERVSWQFLPLRQSFVRVATSNHRSIDRGGNTCAVIDASDGSRNSASNSRSGDRYQQAIHTLQFH
jgi:hypothetical protein